MMRPQTQRRAPAGGVASWTSWTLLVMAVAVATSELPVADAQGAISAEAVDVCLRDSEILNPISLQCAACPANASPITEAIRDDLDLTLARLGYEPRIDGAGVGCICNEGFRNIGSTSSLACEQCPASQVVSMDGSRCLSCGANAAYLGTSCVCQIPNAIQVENASNGNATAIDCVQCQPTHFAFVAREGSSEATCLPCPDASMEYRNGMTCQCPPTTIEVHGSCQLSATVATHFPQSADLRVQFENSRVSFTSRLFVEHLQLNWINCDTSSFSNRTACHALANLCVLQQYEEAVGACRIYRTLNLQRPTGQQGWESWPLELPWLYYTETTRDIRNVVVPKSALRDNKYTFYAIPTTIYGNVLSPITLGGILQMCSSASGGGDDAWQYAGNNVVEECALTLEGIMDRLAALGLPVDITVFFELYVESAETETGELFPVPVFVEGDRTQRLESPYVRRFFLLDKMAGVRSENTGNQDTVVVFAQSLTLDFRIVKIGQGSRLPVLTVHYVDVSEGAFTQRAQSLRFQTRHLTTLSDYNWAMVGFLVVFIILAAVYAAVMASQKSRRDFKTVSDGAVFSDFFAEFCFFLGTSLFWLCLVTCLYWFIVFNAREEYLTSLPMPYNDEWIPGLLLTACVLKAFELLWLLRKRASNDIFIIDWETPSRKLAVDGGKEILATTVWRKNMICNEWNELAVHRKAPLLQTIIFVLVVLIGFSFDRFGENDPRTSATFQGGQHYVLRVSVSAIAFLIAALVQLAFHALIYDRFIENAVLQFVDLCTISNLSVVVFDSQAHGYYIHGRTPHGYADVDMYTMLVNMKKEADDVVGQRGLDASADGDLQTFEIFIPERLRREWDGVIDRLADSVEVLRRVGFGVGDHERMQNLVKANNVLNQLFIVFLEHSLNDVDYVIKKRSATERFLDATPERGGNGVFFEDPSMHFVNTILLGAEVHIIICELAIFLFFDYLLTDYVLASLLTLLLSWGLMFWYSTKTAANLAAKTLTDGRFLI